MFELDLMNNSKWKIHHVYGYRCSRYLPTTLCLLHVSTSGLFLDQHN